MTTAPAPVTGLSPVATPGRPPDPRRRERLLAAALDLIAEEGVAGVSRRKTAACAGVPLRDLILVQELYTPAARSEPYRALCARWMRRSRPSWNLTSPRSRPASWTR